jgi:hypothetical protein
MNKLALIFVVFFVISCGESSYHEPDFYYEGKFDSSLVNQLEEYMKDLADERNLVVFEKDRGQMSALTQNEEALFISLHVASIDEPLLWVSNVGVGTVLTLGFLSNENFSYDNTKALSETVRNGLLDEMGIEMKSVSPGAVR